MNSYLSVCNNIVSFRSKSEAVISKSSSVHQDLFYGKKPREVDLKELRSSIQMAMESLESLLNSLDEIENIES